MSAISACVSLKGKPVQTAELNAMLAASEIFNRHGESRCVLPAAAFGVSHFWSTPESQDQPQPLRHEESGNYLLFEGRIDNRDELIDALSCSKSEAAGYADAELFLRAYLAWGVTGFGRVIGPFACVIHNERDKTTTLARDAVGDRSLFYFLSSDVLVAASEQVCVLAHPVVPRELNEAQMAVFFAMSEYPNHETYFKHVHTVLPGEYLIVKPDGVKKDFHWRLDFSRSGSQCERFTKNADYAERFLELLTTSVESRMRRCIGIGVMTSGGLDSAPIAALAALAAKAANAASADRPPINYTWAFKRYPECDERRYVGELCAMHNMPMRPIFCDDATPLSDLESWPVHPAMPEQTAYYRFHERVYQAAQEDDIDVLLTGFSGDDLYGYTRGWFWDGLLGGDVAFTQRESRRRMASSGLAAFLKHDVAAGLFTDDFLKKVRRYDQSEWLTADAKKLLPEDQSWLRWRGRARRVAQAKALFSLRTAQGFSAERYFAVRHGVDVRNPFRDRRLLEFVLSLPPSQIIGGTAGGVGGQDVSELSRPIARAAFRDILPASILNRPDKTEFTPVYKRGLIDECPESITRMLGSENAYYKRFICADWRSGSLASTHGTDAELMVNWSSVSCWLWMKQAFPDVTGEVEVRGDSA